MNTINLTDEQKEQVLEILKTAKNREHGGSLEEREQCDFCGGYMMALGLLKGWTIEHKADCQAEEIIKLFE